MMMIEVTTPPYCSLKKTATMLDEDDCMIGSLTDTTKEMRRRRERILL